MKNYYRVGKWSILVPAIFFVLALIGSVSFLKPEARNLFDLYLFGTFLGMLALIVTGVIHFIIAVSVFMEFKKLKSDDKPFVLAYAATIPVYFITWWFLASTDFFDDYIGLVLFVVLVPMLIGLYFVYVLYRLRQSELGVQADTEKIKE
jgi:hypothetical protein